MLKSFIMDYNIDPCRGTRTGRITLLSQTKALLRNAQRVQNMGKLREQKLKEVIDRLYRDL
jgi:hypothetical protein